MIGLPAAPSFRLDGLRALVAGASSGIGLAAASALADAGAAVTLAARRAEQLRDAAAAIRDAGGVADTMVLDVAEVEATRKRVRETGPYDVLVNSAGIARHAPALETTEADFDAVVGVNLRGAYFLTVAVAEGLIAAERPGSLINISSQMALVGGIERSVYCATKHAVEGFTKAMAIEFAPHGVRANTVCPTFIRTGLTEATFQDPEKREWVMSKIKLGRVGETADVAGAVVYLASGASSLVTGTAILVDGGWTAG